MKIGEFFFYNVFKIFLIFNKLIFIDYIKKMFYKVILIKILYVDINVYIIYYNL